MTQDWIVDGFIGRRSQFSTVVVYQTADPKRLPQFLNYVGLLDEKHRFSSVLIYFVWRGLYKATLDEKITYEPVAMQQQSPIPIPSMGAPTIRSIEDALAYIDEKFRNDEAILFIIQGVFQRNDVLTAALRSWVFDDEVYQRKHMVCLFVENPQVLFDEDTIKYFVYIKVPSSLSEERKDILQKIADTFSLNTNLNGLIQATSGLTLHETESIALESIYRHRDLKQEILTKYKNEIIRKSGILDIEEPAHGFEAVGGYAILKQFIKDNIIKVLKNPQKAEKLGLRLPRGLLLFGMGGTGKTLLARALSREINLPFLRLRTENIVSKWYGETERSMARALEIAEEIAPCVLFIDELDRFGQRGQIGEHEVTRRTFSILLEWLGDDRRRTIIIGTTNMIQSLDDAFIRVGRFDYLIPMLLPDINARRQILEVHTKVVRKVPLDRTVNLDAIAEATDMLTGAELEELVLRAARNTLKADRAKVTMKDFEVAMAGLRINKDARTKQMQEFMQLAYRYCNDAEFVENLVKSQGIDRVELLKRELE